MENVNRRKFMAGFGATAITTCLPFAQANAAEFLEHPITAVVGYRPGGGTDFVSRALAPLLEKQLGGAVIKVVNQPGAAAAFATNYVWKKPSDGHWWLMSSGFNRGLRVTGRTITNPYLDWQFFQADTAIMSISVRPDSPIENMGDFIRRARKNPEKMRVSNSGIGGAWHLGGTLMRRIGRFDYKDVPYQGGKPAVTACLSGEVDVVTSGLHEHLKHIKAGNLRNLAIATSDVMEIQAIMFDPITNWIPALESKTPFGGGSTMGLRRDVDPSILRKIAEVWQKAAGSEEFAMLEAKKPRFPHPVIGEAADKNAALWECIAANLLFEAGKAKVDPASIGIPKIEEFDEFWPPRGYSPRI